MCERVVHGAALAAAAAALLVNLEHLGLKAHGAWVVLRGRDVLGTEGVTTVLACQCLTRDGGGIFPAARTCRRRWLPWRLGGVQLCSRRWREPELLPRGDLWRRRWPSSQLAIEHEQRVSVLTLSLAVGLLGLVSLHSVRGELGHHVLGIVELMRTREAVTLEVLHRSPQRRS
eukprot:scaffold13109_cov45-Phaeocystis_antarctica.AAC.1